eukprot:416030_1
MSTLLQGCNKYIPVHKQAQCNESPRWIEWNDLDVLRNLVGIWRLGGRISRTKDEILQIEFKMNANNGSDKEWKGILICSELGKETYLYGIGEWSLIYPTSLDVRPNIDYICHFYVRKLNTRNTVLPRDVSNIIGDFVLGKNVRSLESIDMKLILTKDSHFYDPRVHFYDEKSGCDVSNDFCTHFGINLQFRIVDLLEYCVDKAEKKETVLDNHVLTKLDTFGLPKSIPAAILKNYLFYSHNSDNT